MLFPLYITFDIVHLRVKVDDHGGSHPTRVCRSSSLSTISAISCHRIHLRRSADLMFSTAQTMQSRRSHRSIEALREFTTMKWQDLSCHGRFITGQKVLAENRASVITLRRLKDFLDPVDQFSNEHSLLRERSCCTTFLCINRASYKTDIF